VPFSIPTLKDCTLLNRPTNPVARLFYSRFIQNYGGECGESNIFPFFSIVEMSLATYEPGRFVYLATSISDKLLLSLDETRLAKHWALANTATE
jgi:hypothetical protein